MDGRPHLLPNLPLPFHVLHRYRLIDIRLILKAVSTQLYNINDEEDEWVKIENKIKFGSLHSTYPWRVVCT